jgi:hypothetical protein
MGLSIPIYAAMMARMKGERIDGGQNQDILRFILRHEIRIMAPKYRSRPEYARYIT